MLPSNSALENDSREQTRLDCWSASHLSSALNTAWDAAAGRRRAAPLSVSYPVSSLTLLSHTTLESKPTPVDRASIGLSGTTPPHPPTTLSTRRSIECCLSLQASSDKQSVSHPDMHGGDKRRMRNQSWMRWWQTRARLTWRPANRCALTLARVLCLLIFIPHRMFLLSTFVSTNPTSRFTSIEPVMKAELQTWRHRYAPNNMLVIVGLSNSVWAPPSLPPLTPVHPPCFYGLQLLSLSGAKSHKKKANPIGTAVRQVRGVRTYARHALFLQLLLKKYCGCNSRNTMKAFEDQSALLFTFVQNITSIAQVTGFLCLL